MKRLTSWLAMATLIVTFSSTFLKAKKTKREMVLESIDFFERL